MGRPSEYSEETAKEICRRLMDGESLRTICADDSMPARSTVHLWLTDHQDFSDQYARAREFQADTLFDEIQDIADTHERGEKRTVKADGSVETVEADMIEHRRLRIDARKWMAARLRPKKYSDKTILSGDEDSPLKIDAGPSLEEAARRIAFLLSAATKS